MDSSDHAARARLTALVHTVALAAAALAGALCFPLLAHAAPAAGDEAPGFATSSGDEFIGALEVQVSGGPFPIPYGYSLDPASSVVSLVKAGAGPNR